MNILLVEDDVGIGRFITQGLRARGCEVHWERTGQNAVRLACSGSFNAMILDLLLPEHDGIDLCAEIRDAEFGIPILILTARSGLDDRLDGFAAGADDYLRKPFAFAELVARVEVLLRRDQHRKPDPIRIGLLRIDPTSKTVRWNGQPVEMGRRTYSLLLSLAKATGKVVSREELIEEIWGPDAIITDNALDVCVSSLRRKLAEVSAKLSVEAVRGQGIVLRYFDG